MRLEIDKEKIENTNSRGSQKPRRGNSLMFKVEGMNCQNCVRKVKEAISSVEKVEKVEVDLASATATVSCQIARPQMAAQIISALKNAGYAAEEIKPSSAETVEHASEEVSGWKTNIIIGVLVFIPLMIGEWFFKLHDSTWFRWFAFIGALVVQTVCGTRFYKGAWNQLRRFAANMDTLVSLGSSAAFGYSVYALFSNQPHVYFMESVGIITLISIGHFLEARMTIKAEAALRELMNLAPAKARKLDSNKNEVEVSVNELKPGDLVVIKAGDHVPTDGIIVDGAVSIDESMVTGESLPVEKTNGSKVFAGTINQNGIAIIKVESTGEETALWRIIEFVKKAQESQANIQRLADKVSNVFVPIVIIIALASGLWWGLDYESAKKVHQFLSNFLWDVNIPQNSVAAAFIHVAAVLIIACPCAMGLATPAALMAGASVAARRGILIRDCQALEKTGKITSIVFDKTGTLTEGKLSVSTAVDVRSGKPPSDDVMRLVKKVAGVSNHPISRAIFNEIQKKTKNSNDENHLTPNSINNVTEIRGHGIEMRLTDDGGETIIIYRLGSFQWLESCGVKITDDIKALNSNGGISVGFAKDKELIAYFLLEDMLKKGIGEVITDLEKKGFKVYMITGDNRNSARRIADKIGIKHENVFSEITPDKKAEIIMSLKSKGERVAFAGDGINDAPALQVADLGIAVSQASDIAREAADLILLKSDVHAIPEAISLAQATLRTIKQNLFWAFFYNAASVPIAALGFLSPIVCAAAMGFSDVVVIGNALRLNRWRYKG